MSVYYNEFDPKAAQWIRELILEGCLPDGEVDERSITEVDPDDLKQFTQCHFFAGIGGWSLALAWAGWPSDRPVWSGSCPCQPFSQAGKQAGFDDERHLWPAFHRLINECRPPVVFGEQVSGSLGHQWLTGVFTDLEESRYKVAGADMPSCSVGAPHVRQRLYWLAITDSPETREIDGLTGRQGRQSLDPGETGIQQGDRATLSGESQAGGEGSMADAQVCDGGLDGGLDQGQSQEEGVQVQDRGGRGISYRRGHRYAGEGSPLDMVNADLQPVTGSDGGDRGEGGGTADREGADLSPGRRTSGQRLAESSSVGGASGGPEPGDREERHSEISDHCGSGIDSWSRGEWLSCADGKSRRIEPGISPLVAGLPGRVGLLRGYGNAITPQLAAAFIKSFLGAEEDLIG